MQVEQGACRSIWRNVSQHMQWRHFVIGWLDEMCCDVDEAKASFIPISTSITYWTFAIQAGLKSLFIIDWIHMKWFSPVTSLQMRYIWPTFDLKTETKNWILNELWARTKLFPDQIHRCVKENSAATFFHTLVAINGRHFCIGTLNLIHVLHSFSDRFK